MNCNTVLQRPHLLSAQPQSPGDVCLPIFHEKGCDRAQLNRHLAKSGLHVENEIRWPLASAGACRNVLPLIIRAVAPPVALGGFAGAQDGRDLCDDNATRECLLWSARGVVDSQ